MGALGGVLEDVAHEIARLRVVSAGQWVLRLLGVVTTVGALVLVLARAGTPDLAYWVLVPAVLALLVRQTIAPDSDAGLGIIVVLGVAVMARGGIGPATAAMLAVLLFVAHVSWALAALGPAHARFESAALRLALPPALLALSLAAVVGVVVVMPLSGLHLGPWAAVIGGVAVIGLVVLLVSRSRQG